jgi:hypothetical protein
MSGLRIAEGREVAVKLPVWLLWDPIEPPPDVVRPDPVTWERWCRDDECVGPDDAAKCDAYMDWCSAERRKRFDAILEDADAGLASDQSEQAKKWREFALSLADRCSEILAIPDPIPPRKRVGRKNVDAEIFEAIGRELENANRPISEAEAFRRANKNGTWTERQFKGAITRWGRLNPLGRRRPGRPKKVT